MRRRELLGSFAAVAALRPLVAFAQGSARRPLVAILVGASSKASSHYVNGFSEGLQELGYSEGRNIDIVYRYADGDLARLSALARDLIPLRPDAIVSATTAGILAVKQATATIPIVGLAMTDPEGFGLVTSIARPGGQVTGILITLETLPSKQLQLALEVLPGTSRIGLLSNVSNPIHVFYRRNAEAAAATFGRKLVVVEVRVPDDLDAAFQALVRERVELGVLLQDAMFLGERRRIAALASAARLPTMYGFREHVEDGGLMSYGIDIRESYRRAAAYVDKILKGAKPGDLPVELPTKLELIINLKTAKALGLTIPPSLLARADEVIE
jgi:putative tryptophan/tyrosine transport system substrate-binding protein